MARKDITLIVTEVDPPPTSEEDRERMMEAAVGDLSIMMKKYLDKQNARDGKPPVSMELARAYVLASGGGGK